MSARRHNPKPRTRARRHGGVPTFPAGRKRAAWGLVPKGRGRRRARYQPWPTMELTRSLGRIYRAAGF